MPKCKKQLCPFKAHVQREWYKDYCCGRCAERDDPNGLLLEHHRHGDACAKEWWLPTPPHSPRKVQVHDPPLRPLATMTHADATHSPGVAGTARFAFDGEAFAEQTGHYGTWYLTFEKGAELELKSYDARHQGWAFGMLPAKVKARSGWFPFRFYQHPPDGEQGEISPSPPPSSSSSRRSSSNRTPTPTPTPTPTLNAVIGEFL